MGREEERPSVRLQWIEGRRSQAAERRHEVDDRGGRAKSDPKLGVKDQQDPDKKRRSHQLSKTFNREICKRGAGDNTLKKKKLLAEGLRER